MLFENEINNLNKFVKEIKSTFPVSGLLSEAIKNISTIGYRMEEYYIVAFDPSLTPIREQYIQNPARTIKNLKQPTIDPKRVNIVIELYMKDANTEPSQDIHKKIEEGLKASENLPPGTYRVTLNDNNVIKRTGTGVKDNSIKTANNPIIL